MPQWERLLPKDETPRPTTHINRSLINTSMFSHVLNRVKTSVCWSMIYLCEWILYVFHILEVSCLLEHGIISFMKSFFHWWSRYWTDVVEVLKWFLVLKFMWIYGLWEVFASREPFPLEKNFCSIFVFSLDMTISSNMKVYY